MRVLLDTDVILDIFLERQTFAEVAAALWDANRAGDFEGYVSGITPVNLYYIARKVKGYEKARLAVETLLNAFQICPVDDNVLQSALSGLITDFEDAVQHESASALQLDAIITRNLEDYRQATLPVFSPSHFLRQLTNEDQE
jgi:predicted nucleic acid-binding protein